MTAPDPLFDITDVQTIAAVTYEEPETSQVTQFIAIASAKLRSKVARIDERLVDGTLDINLMKGVGTAMVLRALDTVQRGIGVTRTEYPEISTQYAPSTKTGLVYLTDDELDDLLDVPEDSGDAFSITIGSEHARPHRARSHRFWDSW